MSTKPDSSQVKYDGSTVQDVLDSAKPMQSYTALRDYTGRATSVRITTPGIAGFFQRDGDTATADNGWTVIVDGSGRRWKRVFDGAVNVKWFGAEGDGVSNDYAQLQQAASSTSSISVSDGVYALSQSVVMSVPKSFVGNGATTMFSAQPGFTGAIFQIAPPAGTDPKSWTVSDFEIINNGSASHAFLLDVASAGEYISKFTLSKIISNTQVSSYFLEMVNTIPNVDGIFTSVFSDNWSFGGYYLDNVGDSVILERNTTTGAGRGYYVNQLPTASNIVIRDGNCTSAGGALLLAQGYNVEFSGMQVECPVVFTGSDNALVSLNNGTATLIMDTKLVGNSINTQGNALYCIYANHSDGTIIDGNNLFCNPATGAHIYLDSGARNTVIGNNKYFSSVTGAEIDPIIIDSGTGTSGVWRSVNIDLAGWSSQNTANEHPLGVFKTRDGNVQLRGRLAGSATTGGETVFTLPSGFRPKSKGYLIGTYGAAGAATSVALQILPTGEVQILTAGATGVYLAGVVFSTR